MTIKSVESIRDLGIITDNKFKFDKHIPEITKKANGVLACQSRPQGLLSYFDGDKKCSSKWFSNILH